MAVKIPFEIVVEDFSENPRCPACGSGADTIRVSPGFGGFGSMIMFNHLDYRCFCGNHWYTMTKTQYDLKLATPITIISTASAEGEGHA